MNLRAQKYKFCINTSWILILDKKRLHKLSMKDFPMALVLQEPGMTLIRQTMNQILDDIIYMPVIISTRDPHAIWEKIIAGNKFVKAAGGVVKNPAGKFLLIYRRGWWDLPKGKIDPGEKKREAALREVKEEVGLDCKILAALPETWHIYRLGADLILKKTSWYLMASAKSRTKLQEEEDITGHKWLTDKQLISIKNKVYPNLTELLVYVAEKIKATSKYPE